MNNVPLFNDRMSPSANVVQNAMNFDISEASNRKRKLGDFGDGAACSQGLKKRWVTPGFSEIPSQSPRLFVPSSGKTRSRKRRLFSATIDEQTMCSVMRMARSAGDEIAGRAFKRVRGECGNQGALTCASAASMKLKLSPAIEGLIGTGVECPLPSFHKSNDKALIRYTPREQFWMQCLAAAVRSNAPLNAPVHQSPFNAPETWIVMPASEGGQIFQLSCRSNAAGGSSGNGVQFEVSEVLPEAHAFEDKEQYVDMQVEEL